jgi:hypothetical protein
MRALCLLVIFGVTASAQNLVFTTRVHLACPVQMSAIAQTKDIGFDSAVLRNESKKTIEAVHLNVALHLESGEEIVEKASILVNLAPGESKRVSVGLGRVQELTNKARNSRRPMVQAILFVQSADFADGTLWSGDEPAINDPVRQVPPTLRGPPPK